MRVGAPDGFGSYFLASRLGAFADLHPELDLEIVTTTRLFRLSKRDADIAISLAMLQEGRIFRRKLFDFRPFLYASKDYLVAPPKIRQRSDLIGRRVIGYISKLLVTPEQAKAPAFLHRAQNSHCTGRRARREKDRQTVPERRHSSILSDYLRETARADPCCREQRHRPIVAWWHETTEDIDPSCGLVAEFATSLAAHAPRYDL